MNAINPPKWFRVASWLAVLWMLSGTAALVMDLMTDEAAIAQMSPGQRELYEARPQWLLAMYAVAIASGLAGAAGLVLRKAWAVPALVLSLVAVAIQFGYSIVGLQAIERVGALAAVLPPIFIFAIGALVLWLAVKAKKAAWILVTLTLVAITPLLAQERLDQDVYWKIRQEGTNNSSVLHTVHMLSDVHGPRLTGSPALKAAGEWAIEQMHAWGMKNGISKAGTSGDLAGRTNACRRTSSRR